MMNDDFKIWQEGYSSVRAAEITGVTYRQLDYWVRVGYVRPTIDARGSGTRRRWSWTDLLTIRVLGECLRVGMRLGDAAQVATAAAVANIGNDRWRGWMVFGTTWVEYVERDGELAVMLRAKGQAAVELVDLERIQLEMEERHDAEARRAADLARLAKERRSTFGGVVRAW